MSPNRIRVRRTVLGAALALAAAAPVLGATTASAAPLARPVAADVTPATTFHAADYDDWFYWHCRVGGQWWRPRCHPEWGGSVFVLPDSA
ncbi:hypothetical protein [Nocardia stercoris]|uniref:hypothetical protein n=1 Tax=Nocardia stercoris TaxID=2483361 RepID=UPI001319CE24|nr:hypothetical protein [Nocardia stercoris]